jgi:hypothetical protein
LANPPAASPGVAEIGGASGFATAVGADNSYFLTYASSGIVGELPAFGSHDVVVSKVSALPPHNLVWVNRIGSGGYDLPHGLLPLPSGEVVVVFTPGGGIAGGSPYGVSSVAKFAAHGGLDWITPWSDADPRGNGGYFFSSLNGAPALSPDGNFLYVAGTFSGNFNGDGRHGNVNGIVSKLRLSDRQFVWHRYADTVMADNAYDVFSSNVVLDPTGEALYVAGEVSTTAVFNGQTLQADFLGLYRSHALIMRISTADDAAPYAQWTRLLSGGFDGAGRVNSLALELSTGSLFAVGNGGFLGGWPSETSSGTFVIKLRRDGTVLSARTLPADEYTSSYGTLFNGEVLVAMHTSAFSPSYAQLGHIARLSTTSLVESNPSVSIAPHQNAVRVWLGTIIPTSTGVSVLVSTTDAEQNGQGRMFISSLNLAPSAPTCEGYDRAAVRGSDASTCQSKCAAAGSSIQSSLQLETTAPVVLRTRPDTSSAPSATQTRFERDNLVIEFDEPLKYYGQLEGPTGFRDAPKIRFGNDETCNVDIMEGGGQFWVSYTQSVDYATCTRRWTLKLNWIMLQLAQCGVKRVPEVGENPDGSFSYSVDFAVINYEDVQVTRQGQSSPVTLQREVRHSLPFAFEIQTAASISNVAVNVFSPIQVTAAVLQQRVRRPSPDAVSEAFADFTVWMSVQWPFNIRDVVLVGFTPVQGEGPVSISGTVGGSALGVDDPNSDPAECPNDGPASSRRLCVDRFAFRVYTSREQCDFDGRYRINFNVGCRAAASGSCPLGAGNPARSGWIEVTLASSYHCSIPVDNIGLSSALYTFAPPAGFGNGESVVVNEFGLVTGGPVPLSPFSSSDEVPAEWLEASPPEQRDFIDGGWMFGVARTSVSQARVGMAVVESLRMHFPTASDPQSSQTVEIVRNAFVQAPFLAGGQYAALNFALANDASETGGSTSPHRPYSFPYFFLRFSPALLNVPLDSSASVSFDGVVRVFYVLLQGLGSGDHELQTESAQHFALSTASRAQDGRVSTRVSVTSASNSGGAAGSGASDQKLLGMSASTAAGVAMAVGLLVGLVLGAAIAHRASKKRAAIPRSSTELSSAASA